MGEHYSHLSLSERRLIEEMFWASMPVQAIAARLGRHRGTIHREINRNFYHTSFRDRFGNEYRGYYCMTANKMAKAKPAPVEAGWSTCIRAGWSTCIRWVPTEAAP